MASLVHGAKAFLLVVFAHRIRARDQYIASFRLSQTEPGKAALRRRPASFGWREGKPMLIETADWTAL